MMDIEIQRIERCQIAEQHADIVAKFDARIGDFNLRRATIRRRHQDGAYFIGTSGGRGRPGVTLPSGTETRRALNEAAMRAYHGS